MEKVRLEIEPNKKTINLVSEKVDVVPIATALPVIPPPLTIVPINKLLPPAMRKSEEVIKVDAAKLLGLNSKQTNSNSSSSDSSESSS